MVTLQDVQFVKEDLAEQKRVQDDAKAEKEEEAKAAKRLEDLEKVE